MAQLVGYKRESSDLKMRYPAIPVSAEHIDHKANGGLDVVTFTGPIGQIIDNAGGGIVYTGECAPGFTGHTSEPIWRIRKVIVSGNLTITLWACVPASGSVPAKNAGFDHIWDNRAALTYL